MTAVDTHTQLYAVVEASPDPEAASRLAALLGQFACASLLIVPRSGAALDAEQARPLIACGQRHGVATLVMDDFDLAKGLAADGVHLSWRAAATEIYAAARAELGAGHVVGADAGASRDAAMLLGEAGADYVSFGLPSGVDDPVEARARRLELVEWWAEIFEVPCVAFGVESANEAAELSAAGADFVAVRLGIESSLETTARFLSGMFRALGVPATTA